MRFPKLVCALCVTSSCLLAWDDSVGRDRTDAPSLDDLFISPMGEPFRATPAGKNPRSIWFNEADIDADQTLSIAEFQADAGRFFSLIDSDASGAIDLDEMFRYETDLVPEIRVPWPAETGSPHPTAPPIEPVQSTNGKPNPESRSDQGNGEAKPRKTRADHSRDDRWKPQGAALFGMLDLPQLVAAADADMNRSVTRAEFMSAAAVRFAILDLNNDALLALSELPRPTRRNRLPAPPPQSAM